MWSTEQGGIRECFACWAKALGHFQENNLFTQAAFP